jgi:hypothetical protein
VLALLENPPEWLARQLDEYRTDPERFKKPTCVAVAAEVFGKATRWQEVMPILEEARGGHGS